METNKVEELPREWRPLVNVTDNPLFYLKLVDENTIREEAAILAKRSNDALNLTDALQIYKVTGIIRTVHNAKTFNFITQ